MSYTDPELIQRESTEEITIPWTRIPEGVDPTTLPTQVAFVEEGARPLVWTPATWDTTGSVPRTKVSVGPSGGGVLLTPGVYSVYVKAGDVVKKTRNRLIVA